MRSARLCGIGDEAGAALGAQVDAHRALGWSTIELRTVDGKSVADLSREEFARLSDHLDRAGLEVPVLCSRIGSWDRGPSRGFAEDLDELDRLLDRAEVLGARWIRIMSYPDLSDESPSSEAAAVSRIRALLAMAEFRGVGLLHENCVGWAGGAHPERVLRLLEGTDSEWFGCLFDIGNGLAYGYEAIDVLGALSPFVHHVHVKDGVSTASGVRWVPPGDGEAGVAECLRHLFDRGYDGYLSIEPHIAFEPHRGSSRDAEARRASFIAAGERLTALLGEEVTSGNRAG